MDPVDLEDNDEDLHQVPVSYQGVFQDEAKKSSNRLSSLPNSNKSYGKFPAAEEMVGYGHPDEFEEELRAY